MTISLTLLSIHLGKISLSFMLDILEIRIKIFECFHSVKAFPYLAVQITLYLKNNILMLLIIYFKIKVEIVLNVPSIF